MTSRSTWVASDDLRVWHDIHSHKYQLAHQFFSFSFEKELKNKLQQKSSGITSEEQVLKKSFKYFDLNGNGVVEPDEFAKAIEKIGIMIPTKQVGYFNSF